MYMWQATYLDGSVLKQKLGGEQISSELINRDVIQSVSLLNDDEPLVVIKPTKHQRFFYRRRTRMEGGSATQVCHILGITENNKVRDIWFCFEDGKIYKMKEFVNDHPWFYQINFKEQEI